MERRGVRRAFGELYDRKIAVKRPASAVALLRLSVLATGLLLYALYQRQAG